MTTTPQDHLVKRGLWPFALTIAWNVIEAVVATSALTAAGSLGASVRPTVATSSAPYAQVIKRSPQVSDHCVVQHMLTSETREAALARIGKALADPTRCRLLVALRDGPAYPGELAERLGPTRSNVSNHLSWLRGCGLAVASAEGRHQTRYNLSDPHLAAALRDLVSVVLAVNPGEDCVDESSVTMGGSRR